MVKWEIDSGAIIRLNGKTFKKQDKKQGSKSGGKQMTSHNFYEWVKFKYAEHHF